MKFIFCLVFQIALSSLVSADIGYVYKGDLNGDGIEDSIMSGPNELFGNAGGPFLISLSASNGAYKIKSIGLHPRASALERNGKNTKIWSYWRYSSSPGKLNSLLLDGSFKSESILLNFEPDPDGTNLKMYELFFKSNLLINFQKVEDYTPPDYPWGKG